MKTPSVLILVTVTAGTAFLTGRATQPGRDHGTAEPVATTRSDHPSGRMAKRAAPASDPDGLMRGARPGHPHPALKSALRGALGNPMDNKRLDRWMSLLSVMRPEDGPAIAELLREEELAGRGFKNEAMVFWQTWAQLDAASAWNYLQQQPEAQGPGGTETLIKAWAFTDPVAAVEAFRNLGESPLKNAAFEGLAHGLAESDPAAAVKFAAGLPEDQQQAAAVHITGSIISQQGNEAAQAWFDALPDEVSALQKESARVLLESLSRSTAGAVEKFAMSRLDQAWAARPDEQMFTAMMIKRNGGEPYPYVSEVLQKYPDTDQPLELTEQLSLRHPIKIKEWIAANPDDPALDLFIAGAARASLRRDGPTPENQALLAKIKDPALRKLVE